MTNYQQKFVITMANNMGYTNKDITIQHIRQFLRNYTLFDAREAIRTTNRNQFISFIQLNGSAQIGKFHVEMCIGIPKNYPHTAPSFVLATDRTKFNVQNQQNLLQNQLISQQKNENGEDFINLRFPIIRKQWNPSNNLNSVFKNIITMLNNPPILVPKMDNSNFFAFSKVNINQSYVPQKLPLIKSKQVTEFINKMYTQVTDLLINRQTVSEANQVLDYHLSRQIFLQEHLTNLQNKLQESQFKIEKQIQTLNRNVVEVEQNRDCKNLLNISSSDQDRLNIISEQQTLKEAQVKLRAKIESDNATKFSEYKKIMKTLYDRMFQNQTKILKCLK